MLKILFATVCLAGAAYLGWKHFFPVPPPPPPPSVEAMVSAVLARGGCTAEELANLSDANSKLVEKKLKGRILDISGVLTRALTKGVHASDLILELKGNAHRKINFTSDFQQHTRIEDGVGTGRLKFQKFGHDIVLAGSRNVEGGPRPLFREGDRVTLKGMFLHVGTRNVALQLRELP
jgi:hypothetical protein